MSSTTGNLQLFPPPQKWPQGAPNHRTILRVTAPNPIAERMEAAKVNGDIHELIIRVDSQRSSPIEQPPPIHVPERAPSRCRTASPAQRSERSRAVTPAFSELDGSSPRPGSIVSPVSSSMYSPDMRRVASPAFSDCPTLVRSNSTAKPRINIEQPSNMRSMFPQYNPTISLGEQSYRPMQSSPTHIPREKISKSPYSPTFYTPYSNISQDWRDSSSSATPYFTPASALESLWDVANGQSTAPSVQLFNLQLHRSSPQISSDVDDRSSVRLCFGPAQSLPFYSLSQSSSDAEPDLVSPPEQEILVRRHHPTQPTSIPIIHTHIRPPPPAPRQLDPNQPTPTSAVVTTIYPKLAALSALDAAANSPAACNLAVMDPDATSPAARRLAEDVLRGAAQRECSSLVWTSSGPQPSRFRSTASHGSYALHHPTLGVFEVEHEGAFISSGPSISPALSSSARLQKPVITIRNPAAASMSELPNRSTTSLATGDSTLARLDLSNDSLVLNVAAILHLGNKYFLDVAVTALLAVLVAEEKRAIAPEEGLVFAAPPTAPVPAKKTRKVKRTPSNASRTSQQQSTRNRWWGAPSTRTQPPPPSHQFEQPFGAPPSYTPPQPPAPVARAARKTKKRAEPAEPIPYDAQSVATTLFEVLRFSAKAIIWILQLGFKALSYGMHRGAEAVREHQERRNEEQQQQQQHQQQDIEMGRL